MKKTALIIVFALILIVTYSVPGLLAAAGETQATVSYYTKGNPTGNGVWLYGDTFMTTCKESEMERVRQSLGTVEGMSVRYAGDHSAFNEAQKQYGIAVQSSESIDGTVIVYGYSEKLGRTVTVDGKQVNIQIAVKNNFITVGTPLIMGSY